MLNQKGQALITLIFFTVIAVTIISAAVSVLFTNTLSTTSAQKGQEAYFAAESGAEDGFLHLLRNPQDSGTYQITQGVQASVTIDSVAGTIVSTGSVGDTVRTIRIETIYNNGAFTISSWKEIN